MLTKTIRIEVGNPLPDHSSSVGSLGDITLSKRYLVFPSSPLPTHPPTIISQSQAPMGFMTGPDSFVGAPSSCCLLEGLGWAGGAEARAENKGEEHR